MIQITLASPSYDEIIAMRERNQLMEDWRRDEEMALAAHNATMYFDIVRDGVLIGRAWFDEYTERAPDLGCNFGVCVEQEWRGKWLPEASVQMADLLALAFESLGVSRVSAKFDRRRTWVEKFYKKLGFEYEGRAGNGLVVDGRRRDLTLLGLTEEAFKEVRDALVVGSPSSS